MFILSLEDAFGGYLTVQVFRTGHKDHSFIHSFSHSHIILAARQYARDHDSTREYNPYLWKGNYSPGVYNNPTS